MCEYVQQPTKYMYKIIAVKVLFFKILNKIEINKKNRHF